MERISRRKLIALLGVIPAWMSTKAFGYAVVHPSATATPNSKKSAIVPVMTDKIQLRLAALKVGSSVKATYISKAGANASSIVVHRKDSSTVVAYSAICTHMGCTVKANAKTFNCPCHGSVYDSSTGKVINGPAPRSLTSFKVNIKSGALFIQV